MHKKYAGVVTAKQDEYQVDEKNTLELFRKAKLHRPTTVTGSRVLRRAGRRPINSTMALLLLVLILAIGALLVSNNSTSCVLYKIVRTVGTTYICVNNVWRRCQWLCVQASASMGHA